jgi:protein-export SecD/SecF family membrane protein
MAIVLGSSKGKVVISAPVINDVISDRGQISGGSTSIGEDLALKLRSGAIPTAVTIIDEKTVGPSLGRDSIRAGVFASLLGFVGVAGFMLIYYRLSGVNAVIALLMNVVLVLGAMAYFGSTLTLPGIAGLILTVGMAVDSNVLIFERIREELRLGKAVRTAIDQGFSRAFGTIVDTHVTTIVSAFFLFTYGTGPVRGFAVTLVIGLAFSMFTAVFVSRVIYDLVLGDRRNVRVAEHLRRRRVPAVSQSQRRFHGQAPDVGRRLADARRDLADHPRHQGHPRDRVRRRRRSPAAVQDRSRCRRRARRVGEGRVRRSIVTTIGKPRARGLRPRAARAGR